MAYRRASGRRPRGVANNLYLTLGASALVLAGLLVLIYRGASVQRPGARRDEGGQRLFLFCAAGMRYPIERIVADYQGEYGVRVEVQYGGSNTLLNQLAVGAIGDLYLAGDEAYMDQARERGLIAEVIPLARSRPVIAVPRGNPKGVRSARDLLRSDVRVALGNPDAAAIGKRTRELLAAAGLWDDLARRVEQSGVFKPTVNDVANDVKLGSVDAGVIWDSTAAQYPELEAIRAPELEGGATLIEIAVLRSCRRPTAALRLARYIGASDRGLVMFREEGFEPVEGDPWAEVPEVTFFAGAVNRRALEPIIKQFEQREGVRVNTVYNGCGILTAQMRTLLQEQNAGFPDMYMACDVYYLETVKDWFQEAVDVSDTDIVIAVQRGNPKNIQGLRDLLRPDVRVVLGQPDQCTIGVLSRRLLQAEGMYDELMRIKDVPQKSSSAMLVPDVAIGAADAALAYRCDTLAAADRVEAVAIASPLAKAVQPFSIARSSKYKNLARRLFQHIAQSREVFAAAGFHWRLDDRPAAPEGAAASGEPKPGSGAR